VKPLSVAVSRTADREQPKACGGVA
jgi:hypothetical protein